MNDFSCNFFKKFKLKFFSTLLFSFLLSARYTTTFFIAIIEAAMNLFINSNAQELLKEMKPALKEKLTILLHNFMENLFSKISLDEWIE